VLFNLENGSSATMRRRDRAWAGQGIVLG